MLPRPATMVTAVVVTFAIAGVLKLSTRSSTSAPNDDIAPSDLASSRLDSEPYRAEIESTAASEEAPVVAPPEVESSTIEDFRRAIAALEALAQRGRRVCDDLGEPFYDFERPSAEGDAHIEKWNTFAREWEDDVSRAASLLPSPPSWDADPNLVAAYQDVTNALRELRQASMGSGESPVPSEEDWSARFDEAERLLGQSTERLLGETP